MTLSLNAHPGHLPSPSKGSAAPLLLTPGALWKRYGVPRDLIYSSIHAGSLKAYDMGSPKKPRFMVSPEDFETWLETRRVAQVGDKK